MMTAHQNHDKNGKNGKTGSPLEVEAAHVDDVAAGIKAEFEAGLNHVADEARETINTVQERAKQVLNEAQEHVQDVAADLGQRLKPVDKWIRTTASEHPYLVIGSTLGAGFLTGFLIRRRAAVSAGVAVGFMAGCYVSTRVLMPTSGSTKTSK